MAKKKRTSKDIKSESTITRMQELGSAWIFKRAIQENATWQDSKAILKDPKTINEIKKIWSVVGKVDWDDEVDKDWLESFYKQQKVLLGKIGQPKFTLYTRDVKTQSEESSRGSLRKVLEKLSWNG